MSCLEVETEAEEAPCSRGEWVAHRTDESSEAGRVLMHWLLWLVGEVGEVGEEPGNCLMKGHSRLGKRSSCKRVCNVMEEAPEQVRGRTVGSWVEEVDTQALGRNARNGS